jgi:hypothetical protein
MAGHAPSSYNSWLLLFALQMAGHAPSSYDGFAVDVSGVVRTQERSHRCDFGRFAESPCKSNAFIHTFIHTQRFAKSSCKSKAFIPSFIIILQEQGITLSS